MKKFISPLSVLVVGILVIQAVCIGVAFSKIHKLESVKPSAQNQEQENLLAISMAALNATSLGQPAVSVKDGKVYFPDIHLALPLNNDTLPLLYGGREVGSPGQQAAMTYDVTTRGFASLSPVGIQHELACTPIRLAFEAKANPYNPHEKNNAAVQLADGLTLQIYADDNSKCAAEWQAANVNPDALKKLFEQATSY